jgi:predicted DNA-binding protein (MmcQ/YjbR family)
MAPDGLKVRVVDLNELRRRCLDMPDAVEEHPFGPGALVFKVAGKMFALIGENAEPLTISLKCDPDIAASLRATHPAVVAGYHLNKRHWITVTLDGSVDDQVPAWIEDSWDLVVDGLSRRVRDDLRGTAP